MGSQRDHMGTEKIKLQDTITENDQSKNTGGNCRDGETAVDGKVTEMRKEQEKKLDKIRGGLFGGAVGDALGYPVEFQTISSIESRYGKDGIRDYELDTGSGQALISDDTQMTLFTANGILVGETRKKTRGIGSNPSYYINDAYRDWYFTQTGDKLQEHRVSWLLDIPELYSRRAPGATCLNALRSREKGSVKNPLNDSKGCGGIMRVAPLGLYYHLSDRDMLDMEGAEVAALTHGHSLGYMPAAVLTHIVNIGVYGGCGAGSSLEDAVHEAMQTVSGLFVQDAFLTDLQELVARAVRLSKNDKKDTENIRSLGEGWVAEETLAIAIYCSLRYQDDFSKGIIAAVNHSGDSDSTGAVTGNILGAWLGYSAIEQKWKEKLELGEIILELADDLCYGCPLTENRSVHDPVWKSKYLECRYSKAQV